MKKLSVKAIALVMSLMICATLLSACGGGTKQAKNSNEPVTITFYTWEKTGYTEQQNNIVKAFEDQNPNIKVKFVYPTDNNNTDYLQKMNTTLMSTNNDVDIFGAADSAYIPDFVKAGLIEPLDDYFKKEGKNFDDIYNFHFKIDGKTYVIPTFETAYFVMLNKTLLDKAGLPLPPANWTWDDYKEYAKKLTSGTGKDKIYGSFMNTWNVYLQMGIFSKANAPLFYDENKNLLVDQPMFKDWVKLRHDMESVDKSQVSYSDVKSMNLAYRTLFFNGQVAMLPTGSWMISEIKNVSKYPHDFVTAFAPIPKFEDGKDGRTYASSHYFGISKNSKHKEEAYKFLRFYSENRSKIGPLTGFTDVKNQDRAKVINDLIGSDTKYYDVDSLIKVYSNPNFSVNYLQDANQLSKNDKQIQDLVSQESEKYLMGAQTLDQSVANMMEKYKSIKNQ